MKIEKFLAVLSAVSVLSVLFCQEIHAGTWGRVYKTPEKNINTIVIIGNYRIPRLLAELVQQESRQPIIVVPASGKGNVIFMPADREDKTIDISPEDLPDFINFLNPERILVLGDQRYVPEEYTSKIAPIQTVITVTNKDWFDVARTTSRIMDLKYLVRDFKKQQELIKSGKLYRPGGSGRVPAPAEDIILSQPVPVVIAPVKPVSIQPDVIIVEEPVLIDETYVVPK